MKRMRISLLLCLSLPGLSLAFAQPAVRATSPIEATLTIPDSRVLPGVPVEMWVALRNPTATTVMIGTAAQLLVRRDDATEFWADTRGDSALLYQGRPGLDDDAAPQYVSVEPGETKVLTLPLGEGLRAPAFFADWRLSPPGRYSVRLLLGVPPDVIAERLPSTYMGAALSSEATFARIEPSGVDAHVWERMKELSNGQWSSVTIDSSPVWEEILQKYATSNYAPYALLVRRGGEKYGRRMIAAMNRFPDSPVRETIALFVSRAFLDDEPVEEAQRQAQRIVNASTRPTTRLLAFGRATDVTTRQPSQK